MKKMKLIFTFIILATSLSFLYAGWDFVAGGYISKIDFVGNDGWAVLSEGLVIHTPDGGTTWGYQETDTSERLYDVSFVSNLEGWVAGNDGLIFHTTDGGNTWTQQNSSTTTNLQSICFVDALNGWAAGSYGEVLHTSDGGVTWAAQTSGISSKIYSIFFVDALNGWAVAASDYIIHTTDGGATWVTQTNPTTDSMKDIIFYDVNEGWATGLKKVIHTVDGGATWVQQANPADENLYGIGMGDNNHLWVVGIDGEILVTTDGGTTWTEQSFSLDWFLGAYFEDNLTGWIVGSGGAIYKTTDGGSNWIAQQAGTSSGLRRTVFVDENNVWGCGTKGFIIHSGDGGLTWESKDSGFDDWIWDITFASDNLHGWAAGDDQTGETPILATVDGGETWVQQLTGIYVDIVGIEAVSNTEVFAAAKGGNILHTTDGGTTWNQQTSGVTVDFKSIEMVSEDIGWIVGSDGTILYTDNGGANWAQQTSGTTENIYDVSFIDFQNGWAVAYGGVILHTTDGGTTWSSQPSGTTGNFTRVSAIDLNEVWAIAGEGFHTTDGGLTWTAVPIPCSIGLWGLDFVNSNLGVAMGNGGIVTRFTSEELNPPTNVSVDPETWLLTWEAPEGAAIFTDNFDSYTAGDFLCTQTTDWFTWGNTPGGTDDCYVVDVQSNSPSNSLEITGASDIIHPFGDLTTGAWGVSFMMYIEPTYGGYFNLLHEFTEWNAVRTEWALEAYFGSTGSGDLHAGGTNAATFTHPVGSWFEVKTEIDLDADWAEFYVDGVFVHAWQWSLQSSGGAGLLQLGAIDIFAAAPVGETPLFYIDDFAHTIMTTERVLSGFNVYLDDMVNSIATVGSDVYEYQYTGLIIGQPYLAGVSALYEDPTGESDVIEFPFTPVPPPVLPPENLTAEIVTFNDVLLNWEAPGGEAIALTPPQRTRKVAPVRFNSNVQLSVAHNAERKTNTAVTDDLRLHLGYNVYKDGVEIYYVPDPDILTYTDLGVEPGVREYYVTAVYDEGESVPSNMESVEIILPIPQNPVANFTYPNVLVTWDPITDCRDLSSYSVYRDGVIVDSLITSTMYVDPGLPSGDYIYNITAVYDGDWESDWSVDAPVTVTGTTNNILIPVRTELSGNYPNPFNPTTTIKFSLKEDSDVSIMIYNIKGAVVRTLIDGEMNKAYHEIIWDGKDNTGKQVGSGVYFYKMKAEKYTATKKMILMK